jgi:serine/threonine-protein kinase
MTVEHGPVKDARLGDLFDQALQIEPEDLDRWLDTVCRDDAQLRAALQRLLRADAMAGGFMETPPSMIVSAAAADRADAESSSATAGGIPQAFGVYRVVRSIGVGGMGEVWLAQRDDGEFEQRVAIKQLAYPTPGLMQRFRQERQILARLDHPNIAHLIDGGLDAGGAPYLVMEFVEGQPITQYVQAKALELRARLELFLSVCEAVQYAHQNLIVHRDLKPANIFVTTDGIPKLLDFGIAKVLESSVSNAQTQTAARLLTPDYAAPEQFNGGSITTATDVYALGVVLYELLASRRPARAKPPAASDDAIAVQPPSGALQASATNPITRRSLRGDLDRITLKALARDPQRRYASAEALAGDIRLYLDGRPISARRDSLGYRFGKYAKRNRYLLGAGLIVLIVCLAATVISVRQARLARDEAQRASAVRQFLVGVFHEADPDENKGQPLSARQLLEKGERQIEPRLQSQPALEADVTTLLGQLYAYLGDEAHGDALLTRALAISENSNVPDDVRARVLINIAAMEAEIKAKFDVSLAHARAGLALIHGDAKRSDENIATAHFVIGLDLIKLGHTDEAIALLRASAPADQALLGDHSGAVAEEWVKLGKALGDTNRYDEAEAAFTQALTIVGNVYGEDSNRLAHVLDEMAAMYCDKGDCSQAETFERRALRIRQQTLGPDHPDTLNVRHKLLLYIESQGRYAEALPQRLALAGQINASKGINPLKMAVEYDALGIDQRELGQFAEAETMTRKALALIDESQGPHSLRSLNARANLAALLQLQGRYPESDAEADEGLQINQQHGAPPTSFSACVLRERIGQNLRLEHSPEKAVRQLQTLIDDDCVRALPETDPWRAQVLADLSQAQLDSGDIGSAMQSAQAAVTHARMSFPAHHYKLGVALFALARVTLAAHQPGQAEILLREALSVRSPPYPFDDPRVLELKVALVNALAAQGKETESHALRAQIKPLLDAAATPYALDLRARLAQP